VSNRPTKTPAIPAPTEENLLEVAKAVKILLDIREGRLGDPRDAFLTVRDASSASGFQLSLLGGGGGGGGGGGNPGDTTPPPAPVGLTATGAFALIVLQWNSPATPNNIAYAEVWRSDTDVLGSAVMIGTSASRFYTDSVGSSRSYFYWIRFVTRANIAGPYNATSGTAGSTSTDPQTVLDVLNSALRESHLYRGLSEPIAGIIASQDAAAEAALSATLESRARARNSARAILSLVAVNNDTYAALEREAFVRAEETGNLFGQYTVKVDLNGYVTGYGLASSVVDGVPTSAFGVVADRFFIAPVATNPGASDGAPFYVITTPTTIDGVVIQPGTYMKSAFIADATIGTAKIRSIAADKITAGYTASVDLESAVFAGSEFYIGGTVTYEFGDPARPTQRTGIASVSNPNVSFNSLGASFNVDYFRVFNGATFETPFEISGGLVRAKRAQIQDLQVTSAKIDDMIQSNNWNGSYVAPAPSTDPSYSSVTLLLNFDGSLTADQSLSAASPVAATGYSLTSASPLAGSQSVLSTTSSQLIYAASTAFNQRSAYTLEFRIRRNSGDGDGYFMARSAVQYIALFGLSLSFTNYGGAMTIPLTSGANHHIALCSDGTTVRVFRDGVLIESAAALAQDLSAQPFALLGVPDRPDLPCPVVTIDTFRLTQGVARYTSNFTPPSGPLPGASTPGFFTNFGTAGWAISKAGDVAINSLYSRGAIAGGGFSPVDWSWPTSGGGFFVGPQGIRIGREASGQFFEVAAGGAIRAPGLNISGGVLTLGGSAGSAVIQNTSSSAFIDLDASADEPFIQATSAGASTIIYANGKAFFTNEETSGTWFGAAELIGSRFLGGGDKGGGATLEYFPQEALVEFDTGFRADLLDIRNRSFTARVGNISAARVGGPSGDGAFLEAVQVEASTSSSIPFTVAPFNPANNPYGGTSCAIFIVVRLRLRPLANWAQFTSFQITSLSWVLDRVA
jgi:hypothetical protein